MTNEEYKQESVEIANYNNRNLSEQLAASFVKKDAESSENWLAFENENGMDELIGIQLNDFEYNRFVSANTADEKRKELEILVCERADFLPDFLMVLARLNQTEWRPRLAGVKAIGFQTFS